MSALLNVLLDGYARAPELEVTGVEIDSRRVTAGDAFLAVKGIGSHGLQHVELAMERGASAVVWEPAPGIAEPEDLSVPQIAVAGLSKKVGAIAARFHGEPAKKLFTVGVTGTDGKTSTAYLVAQALDVLGVDCGYLGTIGYGRVSALKEASHTTPDAIRLQELFADFVAQGLKACAMEVSSHALDQARVSGIGFDVSILTNITRDHLDYHGTVEAYAAAKKKLFTEHTRGVRVINRDDAVGAVWASQFDAVIVYGIEGAAPANGQWLIARTLQLSTEGLVFTLDSSWGSATIRSRLLGHFNVYNLLAALAALLAKGVTLADAVTVLAQLRTVPGRIEGFKGPKAAPLVVVDYAHTPEALTQILKAARAHCAGKLICVFGCGGDRDRGKRPLMGAAAEEGADIAIITDDNPRSEAPQAIVADIVAGFADAESARVIHDRAEAIRTAVQAAGADDVVVIAGKGHETTQTVGTDVRAFSDRAFVAALVGAEERV
ncbi:MAG: UDP-N-acetylmuramoyl-L-alanyl-D-glutamate--2,6-diaminopimelate ligase [Stagnimonas sp.]|nr:UDP-N-acetylmuramoyl-L-alanyl-D-glutamate--2,6-diaminopimelate ligase [Stagnimonas sp.]